MRHSTWLKIEASPLWHGLYRRYRWLPDRIRAPMRVIAMPQWHLAAALVRTASRGRIVAGPFRGVKVSLSGLSSRHLLGYILGSQELELRDAIARIIERKYRTVLNIGAADGYYAVGLAVRLPEAHIEAFEALEEYHPIVARAAAANGVAERIGLNGMCDCGNLHRHLQAATPPVLILMDVEGGEIGLLDPVAEPWLRSVDILVETHDRFVPHVTETLIARFCDTHDIECYMARARVPGDFPPDFLTHLRRFFPRLAVDLMNERRTGVQRWLFLTARRPGDQAAQEPPV